MSNIDISIVPSISNLTFQEERCNFVKLSEYSVHKAGVYTKYIRCYDKLGQKTFELEERIFDNIFKKVNPW